MTAARAKRSGTALLVTLVLVLGCEVAEACSVCFGDPDAPETKAMAAGILFLLAVIGTVLGGFASLFLYWMHRSNKLAMASEGATH